MKQSLQLRLGQHLTMTPQLQQAIRLLQLSTLDLRQEIQQALDSNLMLELEEGQDEQEEQETLELVHTDTATEGAEELELQPTDIPDELPVDSNWEDTFENISPTTNTASHSLDDHPFETSDTTEEGLREGLLWQLGMSPISERDQIIGQTLIDDINEDGFLSTPLEELHQSLPADMEIELDEVEAVLHTIQNFDPPGVAARDLRESLLLQLRPLPEDTPWINEARTILEKYFDLLVNHDYNQLKRRLKLDEDTLRNTLGLIQSLNPRPGSQISNSKPEYIVPDVYVRRTNGSWLVELNPEASPRLRINNHYASLIKQVNSSVDSTYMKNHLQEARWFIKSLQSRNETLLKVAKCIVERQRGFLEHGEVSMKALVLHDIAQEVDMHESTISRVTTRKYLHTPRGIFELKYFFSSHVSTAAGGECSSTAIRAFIKKMIAEENCAKPLSDSKIATILSEQGINVARRTVAKYREAIHIRLQMNVNAWRKQAQQEEKYTMQLNITGHHIDITDSMRDYVTSKLERLERHFDHVTNVHVILTVEKERQKAEATLHVTGNNLFAEAENEDMYAAIDALVDKLDRQIKKHKEKIKDHHRGQASLKTQTVE